MRKIKCILAALVLFSVPAIWNLVASAAGNFGLDSVTVLDKATNVVADTPTISGNTITSTIVFHELNDYVKYGIKLKNSTTTSYEILDITDDNANALVEYRYDNHANEVISAGGSLDLDLTIFYVQEHIDENDRTQNNNVKFTISYLDLLTGTVEDDEIILVPDTGEYTKEIVATNFVPGIVTFAIIFAGVALVAAILYKKKGIAVISVLAIVFTATGVINMGAVAEDYSDMDIALNSELRLRDQMCGEVYWKDPDTGANAYVSPDEFGCAYYDADDMLYFGDVFDANHIPVPDGLMITGFQFTGTNIDVDPDAPVLDDFSVTILYGERTYSITYDYNGGAVATANPTTVKKTDQPFTLNKPTKDTAHFYCWEGSGIPQYECEEDITIDPSTLDGDLEYRALYRHEVIVNDQNGNELEHEFILEGHDGITYAKTFYPVGYTVSSGSCTNNQEIQIHTSSYTVNGLTNNTVCTVNITPKTYNVTLVVNNGSGSGTKNITHGNNATFTGIAPNTDYTLKETVSCTNNQNATYSNGTVTVNNVTKDTTCTMNALPPSLHTITYMQDMTHDICAATTTPNIDLDNEFDWTGEHYGDTSYVPRKALIDRRDNKKYLITKLADGNCWMTQNLALDLSTSKALTSNDTDIDQNQAEWIPPLSTVTTLPAANSTNPYVDHSTAKYSCISYRTNAYYVGNSTFPNFGMTKTSAPTDDTDEYLWQNAGNWYNAYALSAGNFNATSPYDHVSPSTICPKGWTMPVTSYFDIPGYEDAPSFEKLFDAYAPNKTYEEYSAFSQTKLLGLVASGHIAFNEAKVKYGLQGTYAEIATNYNRLYLGSTEGDYQHRINLARIYPVYGYGETLNTYLYYGLAINSQGYSVRCVAR